MNREQQRHAQQLVFVDSGQELELGLPEDCPISPEQLAETTGTEDYVAQDLGGGLTAHVYRIRVNGRDWTLKRAREKCLVQNVDGQTSFLNEVQRRIDLRAFKKNPKFSDQLRAVVDTQYASYRKGIILSPWIAGQAVATWDERRLIECFDAIIGLLQVGLFEWDFCSGNILDDGHIRLFDFGYMYRFDPLTEFNSNGRDAPLFHGAERFETRFYFAYLHDLEKTQGMTAALSAYRLEKEIAVQAYKKLLIKLIARGAHAEIIDRFTSIIQGWKSALKGDLDSLYLSEGWRSHRLDLDDDLRGQTCTPLTLQCVQWLRAAVQNHFSDLKKMRTFFWDDETSSALQLLDALDEAQLKAERWQIKK